MDKAHKQQLREILQCDGPEDLSQLLPHLKPDDIQAILPRTREYANTIELLRTKLDQRKGLSRQIGEAKKQKMPVDDLLGAMRDITGEIKMLEASQAKREADISAYLPTKHVSGELTSRKPESSQFQRYPETHRNNPYTIQELTENTDEWDDYVTGHPAGTLYHLARWRTIIHDVFGHESLYLYARDETDRVVGLLPLVRLTSRIFGDFMVSMPYFNYGGAIGDTPDIEEALMQHAGRLAGEMTLDHIEFRDDITRQDVPERSNKVNMILKLPQDETQLWEQFSPKLRSQIRRPQRENTQVRRGSLELLDDFYWVFARNMRDLGTPVYGKPFFARILSSFPDQASLQIVYLDGKPVAGAFLIGYKERLEIPWASTIRSVNHLSINMLMYWEVLRFAVKSNYARFDFGRSSIDSGTYKFKQQWGAQPKQLYWHYWLNGSNLPSLNPANPKYRLMINTWKKMPIWFTRLIGPMIVKNLP